jgi:uncharacterized repeat protein (TIGR03803 family)
LALDDDGNLFGTTSSGGGFDLGTVFELKTNGTHSILVSFNGTNGNYPECDLIRSRSGTVYGTTAIGGAQEMGTVFEVSRSGEFKVLTSFTRTNGALPYAGLIQATDGNFYGTTSQGGAEDYGVVFSMTPAGKIRVLYSLSRTAYPFAGVTQSADGALYGATYAGGDGYGSIFKIDASLPRIRPILRFTRVFPSGPELTISGRTKDSVPVSAVRYQLNNADWESAQSTNDWRDWSFTEMPIVGRNVLRVYAVDSVGACSRTNWCPFYWHAMSR